MTEVQGRPSEETELLDAYARACREAREQWRAWRAVKKALAEEERAAAAAGAPLPDWHVRAATEILYRAGTSYDEAGRAETDALTALNRYVDRKTAAASAAASGTAL